MTGKANPRFEEALAFAARAHGAVRQERKGTHFPYIAHPIRVAEILDRFERGEDVVVAGFLHDTMEDANVSEHELGAAFGTTVASLVTAVSEPDKSLPWRDRKEHTVEQLERESDPNVLVLVAADKLDNVRSIADTLRHLAREGEDVGTLQREARRAALVLPRHRRDSARQGSREPTLSNARL